MVGKVFGTDESPNNPFEPPDPVIRRDGAGLNDVEEQSERVAWNDPDADPVDPDPDPVDPDPEASFDLSSCSDSLFESLSLLFLDVGATRVGVATELD